ncbi:1088_t:CDS:1, partial [Gigaspora rosea]
MGSGMSFLLLLSRGCKILVQLVLALEKLLKEGREVARQHPVFVIIL